MRLLIKFRKGATVTWLQSDGKRLAPATGTIVSGPMPHPTTGKGKYYEIKHGERVIRLSACGIKPV